MRAYILAGGQGSRLSPRKGFLEVGGRTILERVLGVARPLVSEIALVGPAEQLADLGLRVVTEGSPSGPLAALCAALTDAGEEDALVLPWDAPFASTALLRHMTQAKAGADAGVPRRGDQIEPLFAIYGPACREPATGALRGGERRVISFYHQVTVRWITEEDVRPFGKWDVLFLNVNTTADLERARRIAQTEEKQPT